MKGIMGQRNFMSKSSSFIEYMKLHLISLEQDLQELYDNSQPFDRNSKEFNQLTHEYDVKLGQVEATAHLLSVANDIMNDNERTYV
jgi:hypothetical protein